MSTGNDGNLDSARDDLRSLFSAVANGTEHSPTHSAWVLKHWLKKRDPKVFSEGLREHCKRLLSNPADLDHIAEETYAFYCEAIRSMDHTTRESRWASLPDRLAMRYIEYLAGKAGSEVARKRGQDMDVEWKRIIHLYPLPRLEEKPYTRNNGSLEELKSLLSAVVHGAEHQPTHWFPHRLGAALQSCDMTGFSEDILAMCSRFASDSEDLDSMAREAYGLCSQITRAWVPDSPQEPYPRAGDRVLLQQILYEICGAGCELGCEYALLAQEDWSEIIASRKFSVAKSGGKQAPP